MVTSVSNTALATDAAKTNATTTTLSKDFNQFLTLLTTQLQNQDPLNPMDSAQFTQQLVAFSGVEQQINTNQKLDNLLALQLNTASTVGLGYVGMDITYTSAEMNHVAGASDPINYTLASDATTLKVNIYDEAGNIVRSIDGGKSASSANKVVWDGKDADGNVMKAGTYGIQVAASDADGKTIATSTAVTGTVKGIETQDGSIYLLVGDRAVALNSVIQAVKPATASTTTDTDTTT
ncbi:MAG: Flagellar basal-body rod modification protein FlgD [Micavibrio sp.]|nr:Flagellar basal-body rod modification protein FlgD [Micavibrio sp.]